MTPGGSDRDRPWDDFVCCGRVMVTDEANGWSFFYCETCRRVVDVNPVVALARDFGEGTP